jgi:hypothetical protein
MCLFQVASLTNTKLGFEPSSLLSDKEVNVYFMDSGKDFTQKDRSTVKVI